MAITKILARKGRLDVGINYVLNGDKTQERVLTAHLNCDPGRECRQMLDTKRAYGKEDGVQYYHIIQSFKPGEITPEQALEIATEFAKEHLPGYETVIGVHVDKEHIHAHLMFNSVNADTGEKYHSGNWIVDNLNSALGTWNGKLAEIWQLLSTTPENFKGGGVWTVMQDINGALQAIGCALLVLFFVMGIVKTCSSFTELKKPEMVFKCFIRFVLAQAAVTHGMELMTALFKVAQGMISTIMTASGMSALTDTTLPSEMVTIIEDVGFLESIPLWAITLLGSLFICLIYKLGDADGCAESIDELGRTTKQAGEDAESFSIKFKDGFAAALKGAGAAVGAVATAAAAGIKVLNDIAEATEEYRENQGKLNTAFEAAGYSTETAKAAYQDLYAVLGDSDNATESAQLLAKLAKSEEDVAKWGEIAAGVTGTFGDALPINSLIEAANETAKVGQVTGTLADALNWVGISEDEFNEKLSASADEADRTRLITETLSSTYQNASNIFRENNEVLMEANRAQAELDDSMSKLGGAIAEVKTELTAEFAPALSEVMDALVGLAEGAEGADQAFTQAIDNLIGQATEKLPELLEFGADIIINVISGIANASPQLAEGAVVAITALVEGLTGALPQIAEAAAQLIGGLVSGLAEAAPELIPAAANAVAEVAQALVDNAPLLMDAALQLITALGDGLLDAIPVLLEATPEIISSLLDAILEGIPQIIEAGITLLGSLVEDLPTIISTIIAVLPEIISSISSTLLDDIPKIIEAGVKLLTSLVTDLPKIIAEIVRALPEIITGMVTELAKGVAKFEDVGGNLVRGLWTGIQSLANWLWNKVYGWISSIWDGITDFFGIASPSKEMAWVGEMLVEGLAGAVNKDGKKAVKAVKAMASDMLSEVQAETGKVNDALAGAARQAVQLSTQDIGAELRRQKELIASMEADLRLRELQVRGSMPQVSPQTVSVGITYDPDVDYSSLMLAAETLEEFEQYAAQRTAKIIGEHIDTVAQGYADNAAILEQWRSTVEQTMTGIEKSVNGVSYDPDVDYSALMLEAKSVEEFLELSNKRAAKIAGENIDVVARGYADNVQLLEQWSSAIQESRDDLVSAADDMAVEFSRRMDEVTKNLNEAIQEMNVKEEAFQVGENNIRGLIDGTISMRDELVETYAQMGRDALAAYKREVDQHSPSHKFEQAGRFDIQGLIHGAENEADHLDAAYAKLAQTALRSMERGLPTIVAEPPVTAVQERQTAAIVSAIASKDGGGGGIPIYIDKLVVRDDSDIQRIAQELYYITEREKRSRGGGSL